MVREPDKVALGERLFNDPGLSGDQQMACADCHILEQGGDDNRPIAFAPEGEPQLFNTPTVFNAALNPTLNWRVHDGRTAELATAVRQVARYQLGRKLTDPDVRRLLAFLRSLTGEYRGRSLSNHD